MERLPNSAPSLLIGVPAIDKELIRQLDYLDGNPGALLDSVRFFDVPSQLGEQINRHFTNKERIFKSFGMPEDIVLPHVDAHTKILDKYTQLNIGLMQGKRLNQIEERKLAERTTPATQEIAQMTQSIHETQTAVEGMRSGAQQVTEGVDLVNATEESLRQINLEMAKTSNTVDYLNTVVVRMRKVVTQYGV